VKKIVSVVGPDECLISGRPPILCVSGKKTRAKKLDYLIKIETRVHQDFSTCDQFLLFIALVHKYSFSTGKISNNMCDEQTIL
jgi:hypothetical protein